MSGTSNGQVANESTFNGAYMARNGDTNTVGKVDLQNPDSASGADVINTQKEINNLFSFLGAVKNNLIGLLPTFTNSNGFTASQSIFARAEAISAKFHATTGHKHTGAAGDATKIESADLANVVLRGYAIQGSNIAIPGTNSTDVSTIMVGKINSSGTTVKGVVVTAPYNKIPLFILSGANANDYLKNATGDIVFGRLTYSAGVWTLTTFVDLSGTETAYALTAGQITDGLKWFYQELFNPITDAPTYDSLFFVQSDNTTADVIDATSTQRGLLTAATQAIGGVKTFVANMIVSDTTQSTNKDTGSIVTEGGVGVEKNINAGGTILGSNLSGTNTGDVTATTIGATPNANGFSLSSQQIQLQPASSDFGGVLTAIAQSIKGVKTFIDEVVLSTYMQLNGATSGNVKLQAPVAVTTYTLVLPPDDGTSGQVLRTDGTGVTTWVDQSSGATTFSDSAFEIQDNGDASKKFKVEVSGVTTATTRTMTVPNADFTPVTIASAETITGLKTMQNVALTTNPLDLQIGRIKFPATANPSSDVNTLDDYEEGTFTPIIRGATTAGSGTYSTQVGSYTKFGNTVRVNGFLVWTNLTGAAGGLSIGGLPFTTNSSDSTYSTANIFCNNLSLAVANYLQAGYFELNTDYILLNQFPVGGGTSATVTIDTAGTILFSGSYVV